MPDIKVAADGEPIDGAVRIIRVKEWEIAVIRHRGEYFAYHNHCPHQGGPACEGVRMPQVVDQLDAQGNVTGQGFDQDDVHIVCPWHGCEFHLKDGVHVGDPKKPARSNCATCRSSRCGRRGSSNGGWRGRTATRDGQRLRHDQ